MTSAISSSAPRNGLRDAGDGAVDERGRTRTCRVARGRRIGVTGAAAALRHGARILAAMTVDARAPRSSRGRPTPRWRPAPDPDRGARGLPRRPRTTGRGSTSTTGARRRTATGRASLLVPGLLQPAWSWAPVARRLAGARRTVVADLRGHGLSDAPMTGYDLGTLAADAVAVGGGFGAARRGAGSSSRGTGSAGSWRLAAAAALGERCAGLVLVDGGWERLEVTTDVDVDEFLRGLDEPPEVLRSMDAWLADRRGVRPVDLGRRPGAGGARRRRRDGRRARGAGGPARTSSRRWSGRCSTCDPAAGVGGGRRAGRGARRARRRRARTRGSRSCAARRTRGRPRPVGPIRVAGLPGRRPQPDALPPGRRHRRDPRDRRRGPAGR